MKNNQNVPQNVPSSSKKKKKGDPSFKFVDMTSEWEPCMSGIRKEKKYFQLRKQLKGCENFQENYFVISMPKKRKGNGEQEDEDQPPPDSNDSSPSTTTQIQQSSSHDFISAPMPPPNINTSNMNIPIINTRNILRFDNSTPPNNNQFTFVAQPLVPPVKTLANGLVEYNNVKISTNFDSAKKKKRKSNLPPPPQTNQQESSSHVNNNHSFLPTTPNSFQSEFMGNASIISAEFVNDDFERYNLSDAQILDASFIPLTPFDNISFTSSNHTPLPELDTVSISFSEPISFGSDFNFDLPDIELLNVEMDSTQSGMR